MTQADLAALVPGWLHTASVVAALMTIPSVILDVVVGLPAWLAACAHWLNWAVWSVFLLTLLVVIVRAPSPWAALRADPVLALIVVCTTPVLPAGLQMLRVLRLGALIGVAHKAQRLFTLEGLRYAAVILVVVILGGGATFAAVEHEQHLSISEGVWWAIVTVTTIGYGDIVPHTEAGRALAVVVIITGIGAATLLIGAAAQHFTGGAGEGAGDADTDADLRAELAELRAELAALHELRAELAELRAELRSRREPRDPS